MEKEKGYKKNLMERTAHFLAALTIFLKGISILGTPGKAGISFLFMFIGLLFLALSFFHHRIKPKFVYMKPAIYALEAAVIGIIGYLYFKVGKIFLPYVYLAASAAYLVLAVFFAFKKTAGGV
jgi:hypothetical protein